MSNYDDYHFPIHPDPYEALPGDECAAPSALVLRETTVNAYQSRYSEDALNVEIDAPAGVTITLIVNDGEAFTLVVPQ